MPDITQTPVQIDPGTEQSGLAATGVCNQGWFKVGANFYIVLLTQNGPPFNINIFKSTNGGHTWTKKASISSAIAFPVIWCVYDGANTIQISYSLSTATPTTVSWSSFNTSTDTLSLNNLPDITDVDAANGQPALAFARHANGHFICMYSQNSFANWGIRTNSGGAWSAFTAVQNQASHTYQVQDVIYDPSTDFTYTLFGDNTGGVTTWHLEGLNATDGAFLNSTIVAATLDDVFGHGVINSGSIFIPVSRAGASSSDKASIFVGAGLPAPTWTITDLDLGAANNRSIISVGVCVDSTSGFPTAIWEFEAVSGNPNVARKSIFSGGVWGAFTVYYDAVANPPNSVPTNQQAISQVCPIPGSVNAVVSMVSATAGFTAFALLSGAAPTPPIPPIGPGLPPVSPFALRVVILPDPKATHLCRYQGPIKCRCRNEEHEFIIHK